MRVFVIAGEPSGDRLGGALMAGLRTLEPDVRFDGIGGTQMQAQGLTSLFPMQELSVMGIAEILPKYRALKARIRQTADQILDTRPDVLITIDAPDFSLRVARMVKTRSDIRTVHYVAPTVWAWRPKRAEKMARFVDQVLALFPFEPPLFEKHGIECDFVGHPVVTEPVASEAEAQAFRQAHNIGAAPLLMVLPGSRRSEVARLKDVFGAAISPVLADRPDLRIVVPAAASVVRDVQAAIADWPGDPILLEPAAEAEAEAGKRKRAAFRAADVALAASGTVSLELAAAQTPMVIAYRMNALSFRLIRWMALIDTVTLVNIVSETRVVPEFLGPDCKADAIGQALLEVLKTPAAQQEAMEITLKRLGQGGEAPGLRAARAVLSGLQK